MAISLSGSFFFAPSSVSPVDGLVVFSVRIDVAVGYVLGHRVPNKLFSRPNAPRPGRMDDRIHRAGFG